VSCWLALGCVWEVTGLTIGWQSFSNDSLLRCIRTHVEHLLKLFHLSVCMKQLKNGKTNLIKFGNGEGAGIAHLV
jgi:hypothetical protein